MTRRRLTLIVALVAVAVIVGVTFVLPVPYVVEQPGPLFDTLGKVSASDPVVQIRNAKTYSTSGHIYLTTVSDSPANCSSHPSLAQAMAAWFNSDDAVVPVQAICEPNQTTGQVVASEQTDMAESQNTAEVAALTTLGYKVIGHQVIVAGVDPSAPAGGKLRPEDVIRSIDGTPIKTQQAVVTAVQTPPVGSALTFQIVRGGKPQQVTVHSEAAPISTGGVAKNKPYVGLELASQPLFNGVKVAIGINPALIGGPSAGTALALGIIDKLTPGGITGGHTIAGTGTISATGKVGEIGGVQQKVAAAARSHADVFFSPAGNCADAKAQAPKSLPLIKATSLAELVSALKEFNAGSSDFPHC